jgi:hypothetical protein
LRATQQSVEADIKVVYFNCEDYKQHSFPNVLIEILDALFEELDKNLSGWFGRKKRSKELIQGIRGELASLKEGADEADLTVKQTNSSTVAGKVRVGLASSGLEIGAGLSSARNAAIEQEYRQHDSKIQKLNLLLPKLKKHIRDFFEISTDVKSVFVELDDFYHLARTIQPHVADYIHRLCKDVPIYFKIATLRHASILYADRGSQPTGAQERHDYQPINIDFTLADFGSAPNSVEKLIAHFV